MTTPKSVHTHFWSTFEDFANNIFNEDFCHEHYLEWRVSSVTPKDSSLKFKQTVNFTRESQVETADELRFWFPVNSGFFYSRLLNDSVKFQYDNGINTIENRKFNFYGSFDMKRAKG